MNNRLIILVYKGNNARAESGGVNYNKLGISLKNIGRLRVAKVVKVNIVISKFKTFILFSSYLNIAILLKLTIY